MCELWWSAHSILPPSDVKCSCNFMKTGMTVDSVVYSSPLISAVCTGQKGWMFWSDIHSEIAKLSYCNSSSTCDKGVSTYTIQDMLNSSRLGNQSPTIFLPLKVALVEWVTFLTNLWADWSRFLVWNVWTTSRKTGNSFKHCAQTSSPSTSSEQWCDLSSKLTTTVNAHCLYRAWSLLQVL